MPEIQYCKGENMTQEERQVHMKYVLKQLETRNDVVIIDYDFYYSTYITFFYQGYAITVDAKSMSGNYDKLSRRDPFRGKKNCTGLSWTAGFVLGRIQGIF